MTTDRTRRQRWLRIGGRAMACTLLIAACICLVPAGSCAGDSPDRPRRILIIPSYNFDYKGIQLFLQGVMAEFTEHKPFPVIFSLENLQLAAHPSDRKYMDKMAASLKIKYSLEKPDLIIVQYMQALQFMERYGKKVFGDVPVVFAGLSVEGYIPERLPHHYTGIVASFSAKKNIELILKNHPDVKKIYVGGGFSPVEKDMVNEAIKEGAPYRGKVEFIALNDMTFPALLEKLGKVEDNSAIIYQALQLDAAGKVFVPAQAAIEIARAARVPVYGMLDTYMGSGITGGFLINHDGLGRRAAEIAMQWLQTGIMPDTQVKSEPIGSYRFDGRQLKRWKIEENTLPSGSKIEFKAFSVWDSYKKEILGGIFLILLQTVLIIGLLRSRNRRIKTEKELQQTLESLRKAVGATIQVMVSAVETRDPYTAGHQARSTDLACFIAIDMGLPQEKIDAIRMAGSIHDIGKLSIPAEILSKPTELSEIEYLLIKEHSTKGYEILKDVESPWPLAEIVLQHHERMDGSGYPQGLKGEGILMEARILAVADVVESMASHRPYRAGLGINTALEEIEKNRGTLYDEAVVNACLRVFREKGYRFAEG